MLPFLPILGYAETHYCLLPGLSLICRRCPEILTDVPWRIDSGQNLPLLLLIKDADKYPITVHKIETAIFQPSVGCIFRKTLEDSPFRVDASFFSKIYEISLLNDQSGSVTINTRIQIQIGKKQYSILNDNLPALSHGQMRVCISSQKLPALPEWHYGDSHMHTVFSTSHVEFGASICHTARMAKAIGFSWMAVTDHSYDLVCLEKDYLSLDPSMKKWEQQQKEIAELSDNGFVILGGEEVSCGNQKDRNIHLVAIGNREFIKGSGDGARRKWNRKPEHRAGEAAKMIHAQGGLCIAAHPCSKAGWVQGFALNRGVWTENDFVDEIDGLQIWTGGRGRFFYRGRRKWIEMLLKGKKLFLLAGSDAHGDFNRVRKLKIPFLSLAEDYNSHFGKPRTCVYAQPLTKENLIASICKGKCIVTDGPFLSLEHRDGGIVWTALSTPEFGCLHRLRIFAGIVGDTNEIIEKEVVWKNQPVCFSAKGVLNLQHKASYIRAELTSRIQGKEFLCMTNPVWV